MVEAYFANVAAVAAKKPTILGHFDLIKKVNGSGKFFDESDPRYTAAAHKALEAAAQAGCVLEVNTSSVYRGFREDYFPSPAILKEWLTMGGNVTITADAHEAKALTFGFEEAAAQLKELGYPRVLVLGKDGFAPVSCKTQNTPHFAGCALAAPGFCCYNGKKRFFGKVGKPYKTLDPLKCAV